MDDLPALRHRILHYSHGVYYSDSLESDLPHEIEIDGRKYQRFMNYIFIPGSTENLSGEQILAVNELRKRLLRNDPSIGKVNERVRQVFLWTVEITAPGSLLEVGPGFEPLFRTAPPGVQYWLADMSEEVLAANRNLGLASFLFTPDSGVPLPQESIDLVIAIFVLQFSLASEQILELARILRPDGVMIANVYRRPEQSRGMLLETFIEAGLQVMRIADRQNLCRGHEYWLIFRDPGSPALAKLQVLLEQS
jgi:SAM-dependent methyltransferase